MDPVHQEKLLSSFYNIKLKEEQFHWTCEKPNNKLLTH